ncbi:MAG: chemotaxis protein CheD [Bacteroidales bacterium]|nr:chemotaxis protein CheD [Bacteroidales bacterium]MCF8390210.1 chemotaxis protein CheD [Bacteroidales bacterium]
MDEIPEKRMQYVTTGEVSSGGIETILNSGAIGSCLVIAAFDPLLNVGAMAHVMLPGRSPVKNGLHTNRFAANAIDEMLCQLKKFGIKNENLRICLVGGANVLKRENDSIGESNIISVEKLLEEKGLKVYARSVGGLERRTVLFDIEMGCIYCKVGDGKQLILWQTENKQ